MEPRRVGRLTLVAALGLSLTVTATGSAQDDHTLDPIGQYSRALLPGTVSEEEVWGELNGFISTECAAVMRASAEELKAEENWLFSVHDTKTGKFMTTWQKAQRFRYGEHLQPQYQAWMARVADAEFELVLTAFIRKRITACIDARKRSLGGESWLTGTWQTKCQAPTGITPDTAGRITLQRLSDGTARGFVYPGATMTGVEVKGPVGTYGSFSLRSDAHREQKVEVAGRFDSSYPLRGSGTIRIHGEVAGFGTWECFGSWKSD